MPVSASRSPRTTARAPTGTWQPPSRRARKARSAATSSADGAWSRKRRRSTSAPRVSRPRAPWATALMQVSNGSNCVASCARPRRVSPASANTRASTSPRSSLAMRVPTLPRMGTTVRSGRWYSNCARRRRLPVPIRAPAGSASRLPAIRLTSTSAGFSRSGTAAMASPSGSSVGRSFMECTATSTSPRRSASSISLMNTPLAPICSMGTFWKRSPLVRMGTISTAVRGWCSRMRPWTHSAWTMASGLRRVPIRNPFMAWSGCLSARATPLRPRIPAFAGMTFRGEAPVRAPRPGRTAPERRRRSPRRRGAAA